MTKNGLSLKLDGKCNVYIPGNDEDDSFIWYLIGIDIIPWQIV